MEAMPSTGIWIGSKFNKIIMPYTFAYILSNVMENDHIDQTNVHVFHMLQINHDQKEKKNK